MKLDEEALVQEPIAAYLHQQLNWNESIYAMHETFGVDGTLGRIHDGEVVLTRYLRKKLIELNPGLPESAYQDAISTITASNASSVTIAINREKHAFHINGVDVGFRTENGEWQTRRLRLFDFDNPDNNHFLVVREFWVTGHCSRQRRADIVGFINGLPLVFMEVKNVTENLKTAYTKNLADYKKSIPHLFHHNTIIILSDGINGKFGSITSQYEHFSEWKRLQESDPGVVDIETMLKGLCNKKHLLDILENFVLFDESAGQLFKIIARNHQFLGVNQAIKAVEQRQEREGKLGVFWHTQGSGKSYSMVFFTRKVHRKLGNNFTFVVITDREDLDDQIYKTFAGCGLVNHDKEPCLVSSGDGLQLFLSQQKNYIFSLIQKFNKPVKPGDYYTNRDDVIVISDEAHRSQYGLLSQNMRDALPNASFIGFTGTPLLSEDEKTRRFFGDYISTYDFKRAVDDNATVPLYYDARGEKLSFKDTDGNEYPVADPKGLNQKIAEKLESLEINDEDIEQRLERELKRDYHIITSSQRLEHIAADFVGHYANAWENGKAMFVCIDKITCVRMYDLIKTYWNAQIKQLEHEILKENDEQHQIWLTRKLAWMKETQFAVVISDEQGEQEKFERWGLNIDSHRKLLKEGFVLSDGKRISVDIAFKNPEHPFRVVIVCAMWLTGFDVPTLATLYLDKPLKAHTLMQAIARANRVAEGKTNGLIVDYCGILKNLRKALAEFAGKSDEGHQDDSDYDPTEKQEQLLKSLESAINITKDFLNKQGFDLNEITEKKDFERNNAIKRAKEAINQNDVTRKAFEINAKEVINKFKACINITGVSIYRSDRDKISLLYKSLQADKEKADISDLVKQLHDVIDSVIVVNKDDDSKEQTVNIYDISKIDFKKLRAMFDENKRTTVQSLKDTIEKKLEKLVNQNQERVDYQIHYDNLIRKYNSEKDAQIIEITFQSLVELYCKLDNEEKRAIREALDEETLAVFDLLKKPGLDENEIKQIKKIAVDLLATLKTEQLRVANWQEKKKTSDAVKLHILKFLYDKKNGLRERYSTKEIEEKSERVYWHVHRAYPAVPSPIYQ